MALQLKDFGSRSSFALDMQGIAVEKIYKPLWPGAAIHHGDIQKDAMSVALDRIGNTDKTIVTRSTVIHIAQRMRQADYWEDERRRDLTIREAEYKRLSDADQDGGVLPGFYAYGYATKAGDDFVRFFMVRFPEWFRYARDYATPPAHRLRLLTPKSGAEKFYWVPWCNIPDQFMALIYRPGMSEIQPMKPNGPLVLQLDFGFFNGPFG